MHAGHKDRVADFSWNANDEWLIARCFRKCCCIVHSACAQCFGRQRAAGLAGCAEHLRRRAGCVHACWFDCCFVCLSPCCDAAVELDEKNDSIMITEAPSSAKKAAASQTKSPKASKPTSPREKPAPATPPAASSSSTPAVIAMTDDGLAG